MSASSGKGGVRAFLVDNAFTGLAQLLTKLRGVILIPLLVKGLGTESYGLYVQVYSFAAFVGAILALNLHLPFLQFVAAAKDRAPAVFSTLLPASAFSTLAGSLVFAALAGPAARDFLVGSADAAIFHAALAIAVSQTVRTFLLNGYRATERIKLRGTLDFVGSVGDVLVAVAVVGAGLDLLAVLAASFVWSIVFAIGLGAHNVRLIGVSAPDAAVLREALRFSVPLIPASFGILVLERADRFLLGSMVDAHAVGVYSAQLAVGSLISAVLLPLQITLLPKVASLWGPDRALAQKYLEVSLHAFLALALLFIALCPFVVPVVLRHLANDEVATGSALNSALMALGAALWGVGVLQATALYCAKKTAAVGLATAASAAVNVLLNVALIPTLGIFGSAIAKAAAYAATCIALGIGVSRVLPLRYAPTFLVRCAASAAAAVVPVALVPKAASWIALPTLLSLPLFAGALVATGAVSRSQVAMARRELGAMLRAKASKT